MRFLIVNPSVYYFMDPNDDLAHAELISSINSILSKLLELRPQIMETLQVLESSQLPSESAIQQRTEFIEANIRAILEEAIATGVAALPLDVDLNALGIDGLIQSQIDGAVEAHRKEESIRKKALDAKRLILNIPK